VAAEVRNVIISQKLRLNLTKPGNKPVLTKLTPEITCH